MKGAKDTGKNRLSDAKCSQNFGVRHENLSFAENPEV
jgi:hypothetical protein